MAKGLKPSLSRFARNDKVHRVLWDMRQLRDPISPLFQKSFVIPTITPNAVRKQRKTRNFLLLLALTFLSCNQENNTISTDKSQIEKNGLPADSSEIVNDSDASPDSERNEVYMSDFLFQFIPHDYDILDTVVGDLNLDGINDYILVINRYEEEKYYEYDEIDESAIKRFFLILLGDKNNQLDLYRENKDAVYCLHCAGGMGEPYIKTVIKNGNFSIELHGGDNTRRWDRTVTFNYSKQEDEWFLHKDRFTSYFLVDPNNADTKIRTTKDFGRIKFEKFNVYDFDIDY